MCGFVGMVRLDGGPADRDAVARMSAAIAHRGPDGDGLYVEGPVAFGFRRLAILDLTDAAAQPMASADGRYVLVFNGELYNYVELRAELGALGHTFRSTGDTEVLLQAYEEWGDACVDRFNGMWAFVIYDRVAGTLFLSRDRLGVKPLFQYSDGRVLLVASEIKAILASGYYRGGTNWRTAARYLKYGDLDVDAQTFYADVERVPPSTSRKLTLAGATVRDRPFWSVEALDGDAPADPPATFAELFTDAVRLRLRSDVPVGVFLSGGLDSTSIISCIAQLLRGTGASPGASADLHAFSYTSPEHDESKYVFETLARTRADFEEVHLAPGDLWDRLLSVLHSQDEPVHSATALVGDELSRRAARRGVTVILNGQGADETLAGYWNYAHAYWTELARAGRLRTLWSEMSVHCQRHGRSRGRELRGIVSRVLALAASGVTGRRRSYARAASAPPQWLVPDVMAMVPEHEVSVAATLRDATRFSVTTRPLPLFLRVEDRNSMAHGVEVRLPFTDYRLVELAFALPACWKVRGPWNKYVLREAMRGRIPESVRSRVDKMGFPTSGRKWIAGEWYEPMRELFTSRAFHDRDIYRPGAVLDALERHRAGTVNLARPLFRAAQFELWSQMAERREVLGCVA